MTPRLHKRETQEVATKKWQRAHRRANKGSVTEADNNYWRTTKNQDSTWAEGIGAKESNKRKNKHSWRRLQGGRKRPRRKTARIVKVRRGSTNNNGD